MKLVVLALTLAAANAISPVHVMDAALAVAALRRDRDATPAAVKLTRSGEMRRDTTHEAIRGLAHEAHGRLDDIAERYRPRVAPALARQDDATPAWVDRLFGPMTNRPEQTHLSIAAAGNVSIMWVTNVSATGGMACWTCVPGADPRNGTCETAHSYTYHPLSELPWFGTIHSTFMTGLPPGGSCDYLLASLVNGTALWSSSVVRFKVPDLTTKNLFVALGGDMGTIQLVGYRVADQMHTYDSTVAAFDAFWHLGDIAYSTLDPPKLNFEFFWDMYGRQEEPLANHVPTLVTYGNHDFSGGDSAAFINRFFNPRGLGGNDNFYYAYAHGPVLFVVMCTEIALNKEECDYTPGSHQYQWLESTLGGVDRNTTPWLVLGGHRPMYSSDKSTDSGPLQEYIEPLLLKYNVDLELAGHMHCTELTAPVAGGVPNMTGVTKLSNASYLYERPAAPVHVTAGTLGAVIIENFVEPAPAWSLVRSGTLFSDSYGFVTLNATAVELHLQFHSLNAANNWDVRIRK